MNRLSPQQQPLQPQQQQYYSRATTVDFKNPNPGNIQTVLKESWPTFAVVGIVSILIGVSGISDKFPLGSSTLSYITGGLSLAAAGYGYISSSKK
jgi:hypothetical protein